MVTILNKLRQPLTINLSDGATLHLLAKESAEVTTEQFDSPELKSHLSKTNIIVMKMN